MSSANYTRYVYINHKLSDVQNFNTAQYLKYTYLPNNKVSHVEVIDSIEILYEYDIEYIGNQTTYTDYNGNYINYIFDSYGHTTTVFDNYGNSQYFKYSGLFYAEDNDGVTGNYDFFYYNGINLYPDYENVHNLVEKSDILKQTQNPVSNHGFEIEEGWMFNTNDFSSISYTDNESLLGSSSLSIRLTKPIGVPYASQSVYLTAGNYTLIGYIKNSGGSSTSGAYMTVSGVTIISTDDKIYGSDEWQKFKLEFTVSTTGPVTLKLYNTAVSTAYFDNIQINNGFVESRYNQVTNNGFEYGTTGWTSSGAMFVTNNETGIYKDLFGHYSLKIDGDGSSNKYSYQDFTDNVVGGETYLIGGWAKADAVPNKAYVLSSGELVSDDRFFGLRILVEGGDGTHAVNLDYYVPFDSTIEDWQYLMVSINLPIYVSNVDVYVIYQGEGTAYFDNIQFYRDDVITSYDYDSGLLTGVNTPDGSYSFEYDSDGNLIEVQDQSTTTNIEYDPNDTYIEVEQNNVRTSILYDSITKHIKANYVGYDMSESTQDLWFKTTYTYEHDAQYLDTVTDEFGNTLDYDYNKLNGLLSKITDANGNILQYEYNKFGQILEKEFGTSGIIYNYTYDSYHRLSTISSDTLTYTFNYNAQDQLVSVEINGEVVVSYTYVSKTINNETYLTHLIESKTYANGDTFYFDYNEEDLLISMHFNDELENRYEYQYDASGRLAIVKDISNNKIYYYSYSLQNRLEKITDEDGNVILYEYDDHGNLFGSTYQVSGVNRSVYYHYDDNTGEYDFTTYDIGTDSVKKDYTYDEDSLRRLKEINLTYNTTLLLHMTFDYDDHHVDASMGNATTRIYKIAYELVDGTDDFYYEYYYDDIGNIVEIIVKDYSDTIIEKYSYEYDSYNRLIREDIYFINSTDSTSISYTYDVLGNITNIKNYSYTTGSLLGTPMSEKVLTYGNSLLGYNDTQLYTIVYKENGVQTGTTTYSYDDSGNPSNIEVSGNQYAYEYEGRRLIGVNFGTTLNTTYAYNNQGIRVYKSTDNHEYEYILDGDLVVIEIIDETDYIYYTYDVNNTLISMCYNGVEYYYLSDTQGNIIGLMNQSGDIVVEYKYDAWGNIINWDDISSNPIARINPYRYRGYRYDEELNLYYLQSRYYDPSIGRFLSIDDTNYLSDDTSSSMNLYTYAVNNPVMYIDRDGNFPVLISLLAIAVATYMTYGAVKSYNTSKDLGYSGWDLAGYTASGLIAGDYFVVRDNWDSISQNIIPGYNATDDPYINFDFTKNKYYSIFTAGLYAKHLHSNYYVEGRTVLGMHIELQAHYVFDKVARPFGITNGNPAWLGAPDLNGDWTAWIFEGFARGLKPIPPIMPRIYW
jgi:RHS repeat-associated protein